MKHTQEQIDAALRYADVKETGGDCAVLKAVSEYKAHAASIILAAAYRAKCEEVEAMKMELDQKELEYQELQQLYL